MKTQQRVIPGADLGGVALGARPPPPPLIPNFEAQTFCRRRDSTARCRQNLAWAPPPYTNPGSAHVYSLYLDIEQLISD